MTLVDLMQALRVALRAGDFRALDGLALRIEAALPEVRTLGRAELQALARMAEENARGLEAARHGIRGARRRLAEIAAADRGLTYDRNGARSGFPTVTTGIRF